VFVFQQGHGSIDIFRMNSAFARHRLSDVVRENAEFEEGSEFRITRNCFSLIDRTYNDPSPFIRSKKGLSIIGLLAEFDYRNVDTGVDARALAAKLFAAQACFSAASASLLETTLPWMTKTMPTTPVARQSRRSGKPSPILHG
jgi:hypothetical protein